MNLMPTLISIGLAASVSLFYLQNQKDEPNKINYRAALSEFEQSTITFAAHTPLDSNNPQPQSHCENNMVSDFTRRLPAGSKWTVDIAGLDCDTAILSLTSADSDDFNNLLSAARASGRSYATETDTSVTPPTKTIKWTQRLYSRNASDLGIRAQLKNNRTNSCLDNPCSKTIPMPVGAWQKKGGCIPACGGGIQEYECIGGKCNNPKPSQSCNTHPCPVNGDWSYKDGDDWEGCPTMPACGTFTEIRQCNKPTPQNGGNHCKKLNGTLTTDSNLSETRDCHKIGSCGLLGSPTQPNIEKDCFVNQKTHTNQILKCNGSSVCKHNDQYFKGGDTFTQIIECPKWSNWIDSPQCIGICGSDGKRSQKRTCDFKNGLSCIGSNIRDQSCESPCGIWRKKSQCPTNTCVQTGDTPLIKKICDGTDKQFKCIDNTKKVSNHGEIERCDTPVCAYWGEWGKWTECTATCNEFGSQTRHRSCINKDIKKGQNCDGEETQWQSCKGFCGVWKKKNQCPTNTCLKLGDTPLIKQICDGTDKQFKCIDNTEKVSNHGEIERCDTPVCAYWGEWGKWTECNVTCNEFGSQTRHRSCINKNIKKGQTCDGEETQSRQCNGSCGKWDDKDKCPTKEICLTEDQTDLVKRKCNGGDKKHQCINTETGYTYMHDAIENCGTPRCGEWTELQKCPEINTTCQADDVDDEIKKLQCDGSRCKRNNKFFIAGELVSEPCNLPKCGEWGNWTKCATSNDSNTTIGSCLEPKGIRKGKCNAEFCIDTNTSLPEKYMQEMCLTESCEIDLQQTDREILIADLVKNPDKRNVKVNVLANSTIMAPSTGKCAVKTGKGFKNLIINNEGKIYGAAGKGGKGATPDINQINDTINGNNGHNGGPAFCIESANVKITGKGIILGGSGGGGGGGGICERNDSKYTCVDGGDGTDGTPRTSDQPLVMGEENLGKKLSDWIREAGDGGKGGYGENPAEKGKDAYDPLDWMINRDSTIGNGGKAGEKGKNCTTTDEVPSNFDNC
jgi:hypothetical protein